MNFQAWPKYWTVAFWMDKGVPGQNYKNIFDSLEIEKEVINAEIGLDLYWSREWYPNYSVVNNWNEKEKTCPRINWADRDSWPEAQEVIVDLMLRFERAFLPRLKRYL